MAKKAKTPLEDQPVETFYPSEIVEIDSLKPWATNPNQHSENQLSYMRRSLADFGQFKNVVAWGNYIVAGHGLVEAAKGRGWKRVEVKRLPPDWTEIQVEAALLADNRLAQLSTPDDELLADMLQRVRQDDAKLLDAVGYNNDEVDEMLRALVRANEPRSDGEVDSDNPAELWRGMPEFEQEDTFGAIATIKVHFASEEHLAEFAKLVRQNLSTASKFIWFPKQENEDLTQFRCADEGGDES